MSVIATLVDGSKVVLDWASDIEQVRNSVLEYDAPNHSVAFFDAIAFHTPASGHGDDRVRALIPWNAIVSIEERPDAGA